MSSQAQRQKNLNDNYTAWGRFVGTWQKTVPGNRNRIARSAYYVSGKRAF